MVNAGAISVGTIFSVSALWVMQAAVPNLDFGQFERLSLISALGVAVVVLWRALRAKDAQAEEQGRATAAALVSTADAVKELRSAVQELREEVKHIGR